MERIHGYDRGGDRLYRRDMVATTAGQALNELYAYDQMNQLTSMERGVLNTDGNAISNKTFGEQFTFDTTGNWLNYKRDANGDGTFEVDQTRTHNLANEILTISGGSTLVSHDRNGCMTKIPKPLDNTSSYTLVYDAWNRLTQVKDGDAVVATYMYDARNHRIKTTVGTTVTLKYFNQNWQEIESVTNNVTTGYVYGLRYIDDVICRTTSNSNGDVQTLYAVQDPNWNVVAVLNSNGSVAERITYDSFGRVTFRNASFVAKTTSSYSWTKTFTGQVYDSETGLMLYRNRYYHPTLGRFITRDPIGYRGDSVNLYRYVKNRTLMRYDTYGFKEVCGWDVWLYTGLGWCVEQNVWDAAMGAAGDSVNTVVQTTCDLANFMGNQTIADGFGCLCMVIGMLDMLPGIGASPLIEAADCICNIVATVQTGCNKGIVQGVGYGGLTFVDCTSLITATTVGGEVGGFVGGVGGSVPGTIIGAVIGSALADPLLDSAMFMLQNEISQGTITPDEQVCSCMNTLQSMK